MAQLKKAVQTALAVQTNLSNDLLVCRKPSSSGRTCVRPGPASAQRLPGFIPLDVGRRVLRQHWLPLAAGYRGAAAALPRPHRLRGRALEEAARPRHTGACRDAAAGARRRAALRGAFRTPAVGARG